MTGIEIITTTATTPGPWLIVLAGVLGGFALLTMLVLSTTGSSAGHFTAALGIFAALAGGAIWSGVAATHQKEDYVATLEQADDDTAAALEDHYDLDLATELPTTTGTATTDISATDRTTGALLDLTAVTRDGRITLYGDDTGSLVEYNPTTQN